jgi:NADPH-dependent glutamate synthase beta subunit-like oxidoreductase
MTPGLGPAAPLAWSQPGRTTRELHTGGWRTRRPLWIEATAPCRHACPAGEPIAHWIERARAGDWAGAWALIRTANPFPAVTGRVCAHPCEAACNRGGWDAAVAINALERAVGDWGLAHGQVTPASPTRSERVAVVGGGPAGLACAYHLARLGYRPTVFEARPSLGGLLRYGIPAYRLPRAVVEREIALIVGLGIRVETGRRLGLDLPWSEVAAHDAVFLAPGAARALDLAVPGAALDRIGEALSFLEAVNEGPPPALGPRLVVVGGGSTAMDVARSARRLGVASVTVLALESRETMPADAEEVAQALAEGVEIVNEVGVRRFEGSSGAVAGVVTGPARLERASDGRITPAFVTADTVVVPTDAVLLAIGQRPDLADLPPALIGPDGMLAGQPVHDVLAGGDAASSQRTVAHAIGAGTRAALAIHARLAGHAGLDGAGSVGRRPDHVVRVSEIAGHAFARAPRATRPERRPDARLTSFVEVVEGLPEPAARAEAARCFACGHCVGCDVCLAVCPDMAVARLEDGYTVSTEHCKGCGLCARECPRGALHMVDER